MSDNNEKPKTVKVECDVAAGAARMREKLIAALGIIEKARDADGEAQSRGSVGDSWRHLSSALGELRSLLRPEPHTAAWFTECAYYFHHETAGEYRTPMGVVDYLTSSPSISVAPRRVPISAGVPPLLQGDRRFTRTALADVPGIGIEFKEFYTADYYKAICHWSNKEAGSRVYEVTAHNIRFPHRLFIHSESLQQELLISRKGIRAGHNRFISFGEPDEICRSYCSIKHPVGGFQHRL